MVTGTDTRDDAVYDGHFGRGTRHEAAYVAEEHRGGNLANVSRLATHVGSRDDLQVAVTFYHVAVVTNALAWILNFNQRMP